ncbi:DUF397 domain-containing protein [Streptomyces profundus]|uniref:DUF397 domain-containing protein n=1 Tax=Streptomyces profundus TaxID=2867410 RepID=UPI001D166DA8|nr:DUF397 domain-containing protein [Streptomyces sp. MA3_2.13]UED84879.1 DUF397 domain-containing protein [Streptomyces sp. MA3_2.13]
MTSTPANLRWFTSSYSNDQGGDCVQAARLPAGAGIAIRDSKRPDGPSFTATRTAWTGFLAGL